MFGDCQENPGAADDTQTKCFILLKCVIFRALYCASWHSGVYYSKLNAARQSALGKHLNGSSRALRDNQKNLFNRL